MIVRSAFIRVGDVEAHLKRVDTNEAVRVDQALCRGAPEDLGVALRLFAGIARSNARTRRDILHVKFSPAAARTPAEFAAALALFEEVFGISATMPRYVVEHVKGSARARAAHIHAVYPLVDPATGRATKSQDNYTRDELVSRLLELRFGEAVTPGPRQAEVIECLRERGLHEEAEALRGFTPAERGKRADAATRQQANRLEIDLEQLERTVLRIYREVGGDLSRFRSAAEQRGFGLASGTSATLLVEPETGLALPLARLLRRLCKAAGEPISIREAALGNIYGELEPYETVRDKLLTRSLDRAETAALTELDYLAGEAELDGQGDLVRILREQRDRARERRKAEFKRTLKSRQSAIRFEHDRERKLRDQRVDRAFKLAGILDKTAVRRIAFQAAALGVILAGGGLGLALLMGGVAVAALPTRERARALALHTRLENRREQDEKTRRLAAAYDELRRQTRTAQALPENLPGALRPAAGAYLRLTLAELDGALSDDQAKLRDQCRIAIGGEAADAITCCLHDGAHSPVLSMLSWYDPSNVSDQKALSRALHPNRKLGAGGHQAGARGSTNSGGYER